MHPGCGQASFKDAVAALRASMAEDPPWDKTLGKAVEDKIAEMKDLVGDDKDFTLLFEEAKVTERRSRLQVLLKFAGTETALVAAWL